MEWETTCWHFPESGEKDRSSFWDLWIIDVSVLRQCLISTSNGDPPFRTRRGDLSKGSLRNGGPQAGGKKSNPKNRQRYNNDCRHVSYLKTLASGSMGRNAVVTSQRFGGPFFLNSANTWKVLPGNISTHDSKSRRKEDQCQTTLGIEICGVAG